MMPNTILQNIERQKLPVPLKKALSNFLYTFKENLVGKSKMTIGQLAEFCTENSELPGEELPNEPFVLDYIIFDESDPSTLIDYEVGDQFRLVITTRNLLKFSLNFTLVLQTDGTYKLMWQGFPVLIVGVSDFDRHFHGIVLAVCTREAQYVDSLRFCLIF